jgi:hypothetical protein
MYISCIGPISGTGTGTQSFAKKNLQNLGSYDRGRLKTVFNSFYGLYSLLYVVKCEVCYPIIVLNNFCLEMHLNFV